MNEFDWMMYFMLLGSAVMGTALVMPYAFEINKEKLAQVPMSMPKLVILSMIQSTILFAILTFLGLLAADAVGLSITSEFAIVPLAIGLGILASVLLIAIEYFIFRPHMPEVLRKGEGHVALWKRFAASFYGGISEEIMTRLFLVSGIVWVMNVPLGIELSSVYGVAILIAAILFGVGHLPTTAAMTRLTPLIVVRAIVLNGIFGILCGWLFWQYGLMAAMVAHFTGDIVLHVIVPMVLQPTTSIDSSPSHQAI